MIFLFMKLFLSNKDFQCKNKPYKMYAGTSESISTAHFGKPILDSFKQQRIWGSLKVLGHRFEVNIFSIILLLIYFNSISHKN